MTTKLEGQITLIKGIHHVLDDFCWTLKDIAKRPTRVAELVPLLASSEGHYTASGLGAEGVWFMPPHLVSREGSRNKPAMWRLKWFNYITDQLVTTEN